MTNPKLVMALYKAKDGKQNELNALIREHFPTLKEYGLATDKPPFIAVSSSGTVIEVFEWVSEEAARKAHDHPAVAKIWEAMAKVGSFETLTSLPEASKPFPHFSQF